MRKTNKGQEQKAKTSSEETKEKAQRIAKELGLRTDESVIGKTTTEQECFIRGATSHKNIRKERQHDEQGLIVDIWTEAEIHPLEAVLEAKNLAMSLATTPWRKLPSDIQEVFIEEGADWLARRLKEEGQKK